MELLATVDWLVYKENCEATLASIKQALQQWPSGYIAAQRKLKLFDDRLLGLCLGALSKLSDCIRKSVRREFLLQVIDKSI